MKRSVHDYTCTTFCQLPYAAVTIVTNPVSEILVPVEPAVNDSDPDRSTN